tara:strand:- start:2511 stop:2951 length:441 start_codon:yes stop_codon:yes gene_type:complete
MNEVSIYFNNCPMEEQLRIRKAINIPLIERGEGKEDDYWFSFDVIVPQPKHEIVEIENSSPEYVLEDGSIFDWYEWRYDNWGVKWDRSDIDFIDNDEDSIYMRFDTAWNQPVEIHNKVREILGKKTNVSMSWFYHEPDMEIAGYLR